MSLPVLCLLPGGKIHMRSAHHSVIVDGLIDLLEAARIPARIRGAESAEELFLALVAGGIHIGQIVGQ